MAQLFRFLFTDDKHRSEIFTFMIPSCFILDNDTDLKSRDFTSSNQKWSLSFVKTGGQLNAFLTLKSVYEGMTITADYGITLINREHYSRNETFVERSAKFSYESASQGRKAFVSVEALCTLDFMDERGNIQCELEIKNVNTAFSYDTQIPPTPAYVRNPAELKYVSGSFAFGNYEWNVCIQPKLDTMGSIAYLKFYLTRLSALDHLCRVSYRYKLINGAFVHDSGVIEQYSDINGATNSYRMERVRELLQLSGKFVVRLDVFKVNSVFPIILYPLAQTPQPAHFYDRDRQAWMMDSCIEDNCFILRLFYTDINNIPSGYVRVLSFNIAVRHQQTGPIYVFKKPVIKYYYKRESDDGLEITTTIDVNEIMCEHNNGYLDQDGGITVEIEWNYSHLLHQPEYSHLDDIIRKQKLQMQREIKILTDENQALEKQLHTQNVQQQQQQQQQLQAGTSAQQQQSGPRTKSFDNPSGSSSTASSGVGTSISSLNATNANLHGANNSSSMSSGVPGTPNVVKKYMEQKYGNNAAGTSNGPANSPYGAPGQSAQGGGGNGGLGSGLTSLLFSEDRNATKSSSGLFNQASNLLGNSAAANSANNTGSPTGLSSLTSQFTSGIANLKLSATNFQANKLTSKFMNPFS